MVDVERCAIVTTTTTRLPDKAPLLPDIRDGYIYPQCNTFVVSVSICLSLSSSPPCRPRYVVHSAKPERDANSFSSNFPHLRSRSSNLQHG